MLKLDILQKDLVMFQSDQGGLVSNRLPYRLIEKGVKDFQYAGFGKEKILFWTSHEIGVIDFSRTSDSLFEKGPVITFLYREGRNIRQAFWAFQDSHVIFLDHDQIYLLETEEPEPYQVRSLAAVAEGTPMIYQERSHSCFFLDPDSKQVVKRKLGES